MNPINNSNNDESNSMSKYFIHQNQAETIPDSNTYQNQMNINTTNSQMNSSFESIMTSQTNLNNEIMNDLIGVEAPDKKIIKILRIFKKNIKLRNATIKKNFWKRDYINNNILNIKISSLFPLIIPSQGFCLCLYNYMNNKQFKELICRVENDLIINNENINNNNYDIIEQYNMINQEENQMNNLLINPIAYLDNNKHRKELIKLLSSIYPRLKSLKNELGKSKENYVFNYLVIKSKLINQQNLIYGKLYSIFPNINFQLREIQKLSLSSKFKLNKLLISKRHTNIENEKGVLLKNGFITMSSEKRIITLTDDTNKKELQESQSLKQIIFGIWLSLKQEEVTNYPNIQSLIYKHRYFIYRKCLEFILASPKIETIYSPSPDQGIFLLIIFFKTSQCYFEVKIIPNEEEKFFTRDENENEGFNNDINSDDILLEKFGNQWLVKTQKFDLGNNNGQFFFDFSRYKNKIKIDTVNNFINRQLNKNNSNNNMNSFNNFNKSSRNNYNNVNYQYNMNTFPNQNMNYNQEQNQYMMMTDTNFYNNNNNNNFEGTNSGFGYTSQGFKDSKNINNNINSNQKKFRASQSQKKIIDTNSHKPKELFDPLTDIFDNKNNNSNNNSNNNIPNITNLKQNQNFSQNAYNNQNNINNIINNNIQKPKSEYNNQNEYLKVEQKDLNNINNNKNENNNKVINNIGSVYGDLEEDNWFNQSNFSKGLNFPYSNKPNNNPQNMFGQIMMNNNINILNNINNNNNINNSNRDEISQQSNTNYSQYTLGKKIYSNNCSNNDSNNGIKEKEKEIVNNINNNLNNSNKNLNQVNPEIIMDINKNNNYIQYNKYMNNNSIYDKNILKEEKGTQTDDNNEKDNKNQILGLNNIIMEQSKSIQMLQNKVNNLEELLAKVNFLLKKRQQNNKDKENDITSNDNENDNNENNEIGSINKSESLKNSENNINNKNIFTNLNQNIINMNQNNNYNINNNKNNINNNINNIITNKLNEEMSNDNLYKIKNSSNINFVDSNNKLIMGKNKGVFNNEESLDNELSSDLNISDSRNSKELNKSNNVGDKTIEIPKIKYNSTLLNSNNDETENDISSN